MLVFFRSTLRNQTAGTGRYNAKYEGESNENIKFAIKN
jgi:hypothetical protein